MGYGESSESRRINFSSVVNIVLTISLGITICHSNLTDDLKGI
nr:MAG TPA: hypothetical protein [Caudoviricetes sp.]